MISLKKHWVPKPKGEVIIRDKSEKEQFAEIGSSWVYGEILEEGIDQMIDALPEHGKGLFIDLGSGRGNICAYVYVNHGFENCVGIELSKTRWELSNGIKSEAIKEHDLSGVEYLNQDLYDCDISDADVVFANDLAFSTTASFQLINKINDEAKSGSFYMTTKRIPVPESLTRMKKVARVDVLASWMKNCPVYVYAVH